MFDISLFLNHSPSEWFSEHKKHTILPDSEDGVFLSKIFDARRERAFPS